MRKNNLSLCITIILALIIPSVSAWNWCNQTGYEYCVEQTEQIKGINITSKIAINLYDDKGDTYDRFAFSGFAIKGFYADIYNEGEELFYVTNLTNWKEACAENWTEPPCKGTRLQTNGTITIKLGNLYDEYIGCPILISMKCNDDAEWCEWAGVGYIKPLNNTCSHIRVTECFYDEDCQENQYCDKSDKITWKNWTCKETPKNITIENNTRTTRNNSRGYTILAKPKAYGYSPTYTPEDLPKSFFDTIVKIIRAIGNFFSGGK